MPDEDEVFDVEKIDEDAETDDAWRLLLETGDWIWAPKSQCSLDEDDMTIEVPYWLAEKENLI